MIKSQILLHDTAGHINITGEPVNGCGYDTDMNKGLNTVAITTGPQFIGRVYIEGSLVQNPCDTDWFNIELQDLQNNKFEYIEFPLFIEHDNIKTIISNHKTFKYTFEGLPVKVRARVDRTYLPNYDNIEKSQFTDLQWRVDIGNIQVISINWN